MYKLFSSPRNRNIMIGAVVSITAFIVMGIVAVGILSNQPDAEGFTFPTPTSRPTASSVVLLAPNAGDTLYANLIYIKGELTGASQRLRVRLLDADDNLLAQTTTLANSGIWQLEIPRPSYIGEVMIQVVSDIDPSIIYADNTVFFADFANRPQGTFGTLISPGDGEPVGGDSILVRGRASGIPDNRFMLVLQTSDGAIAMQEVVLPTPYAIDDVFWEAELPIVGLSGSALLTAYFTPQTEASPITSAVTVIITQSAG